MRGIEWFKSFGALELWTELGNLEPWDSESPFESLGVAMEGEWGEVMVGC